MNKLLVTIDIDWACESAIEETLGYLKDLKIKPTVFTTHNSKAIEQVLGTIEVGLHPNFTPGSSHGQTIDEVVRYVTDLPHNMAAFRCHRFFTCNTSKQALLEAGMRISSNTCTDLEILPTFKDRFNMLEIPVFLEDGGYLWRKHPLVLDQTLQDKLSMDGYKVILIHPMHFSLNTPNFEYMYDIKQTISRYQWNNLTSNQLSQMRCKSRGIRDLMQDILTSCDNFMTIGELYTARQSGISIK